MQSDSHDAEKAARRWPWKKIARSIRNWESLLFAWVVLSPLFIAYEWLAAYGSTQWRLTTDATESLLIVSGIQLTFFLLFCRIRFLWARQFQSAVMSLKYVLLALTAVDFIDFLFNALPDAHSNFGPPIFGRLIRDSIMLVCAYAVGNRFVLSRFLTFLDLVNTMAKHGVPERFIARRGLFRSLPTLVVDPALPCIVRPDEPMIRIPRRKLLGGD